MPRDIKKRKASRAKREAKAIHQEALSKAVGKKGVHVKAIHQEALSKALSIEIQSEGSTMIATATPKAPKMGFMGFIKGCLKQLGLYDG